MSLQENDRKQIIEIATRIYEESDRGSVLVAQAYLENALRNFVIEYLATIKSTTRMRLEAFFDADKGTIRGGKELIEIAETLGVIDASQKSALSAINTLRNKFAHKLERKHIAKDDLANITVYLGSNYTTLLDQITTLDEKPQNLRSQFSIAAAVLLLHIQTLVQITGVIG